jgi:hypothetical protein
MRLAIALTIAISLLAGCGGRDRFEPLNTAGCEANMLNVYELLPDSRMAIEVNTTTASDDTDARFLTYNASDYVDETPPADTLFVEGGPVGCHSGSSECRSYTSSQTWCGARADEPWAFEVRGTIADTPVAVQGTEVSADHMGCVFDISIYELEYNTNIGQGTLETVLCDAMHNNWLAARAP